MKKLIIRALVLTLILGVIGFLLPLFIGLSQGGFDTIEVLNQFNFYISGGIFLVLLLVAFFVGVVIEKDDKELGSSAAYVSHGLNPHWSVFKNFSIFQLILISFIIFSTVGIFFVQTNQTTFTGFAGLEQQFTPVGSTLFSAFLIPISEGAGFALLMALYLILLRAIARKTNMGKTNYRIIAWLGMIILGLIYGYSVHLLRYSGSEATLGKVGIFWLIGGLITAATGSFIPFWIMHLVNNLLFDIQRFVSNDVVTFIIVGVLVISIALYLWLYGFSTKRRNQKNEV